MGPRVSDRSSEKEFLDPARVLAAAAAGAVAAPQMAFLMAARLSSSPAAPTSALASASPTYVIAFPHGALVLWSRSAADWCLRPYSGPPLPVRRYHNPGPLPDALPAGRLPPGFTDRRCSTCLCPRSPVCEQLRDGVRFTGQVWRPRGSLGRTPPSGAVANGGREGEGRGP